MFKIVAIFCVELIFFLVIYFGLIIYTHMKYI